jgi:putative ABC transport system ATP-binding protein
VFVLDAVGVTRGAGEDHVHPLYGVSLDVAPARVTAVVGPSGSGKSTLLRLLNRMEEPSHGVVRFHGTPLPEYDVLDLRRRVGLLMQRPTPFPGSVLDDNLRAGAPHLTADEASELLVRVGLPAAFLARDTADLSGGEAQRVCLARALAVRPEVLLLDEATSALDPFAANVVEQVVRDLAGDGVTVVMVSHDLAQARRVADDVVVVIAGRVVDHAEPEAVAYLKGVS